MKNFIIVFIFILTFIIISVLLIQNRTLYKGAVSDHFDGRRFFYKGTTHGLSDTIRWMREMQTADWPDWVSDPPQPAPVEKVRSGELRVTYINHATLLIQMDGMNILTDPIWSERAGPFTWLGAKRVRAPGLELGALPEIDVILISHDHYDHLDLKTLELLVEKHDPQILTGLGVSSLLSPEIFKKVKELDWWQEYTSGDLKYTFVPARHGSGRILTGQNKTLWGGFVIEGNAGKVYFAGDTGYEDFIEDIGRKFDSFRLTLLPIGSYEKRWFMKTQHMNPDDSVKVHKLLKSRQSAGYHYATFNEHPEQTIDQHEKDLAEALKKYKVPEADFWVLEFGEGKDVLKK